MAATIGRILRKVVKREPGEEFKELSQGGISLRILTSESLEKKLLEIKALNDLLKRKLPDDSMRKLKEVKRRLVKMNEAIMTTCAPYLRVIDYPGYMEVLSAWRVLFSISLRFIHDVNSALKDEGSIIDFTPITESLCEFVLNEVRPGGMNIINCSYSTKDVTPEYVFSIYQQIQPQPVWQPSVIPTAERPLEMTPPQPRRYPPRLPPETEEE